MEQLSAEELRPSGTRVTEHRWVVAADVPVDLALARYADRRGRFRLPAETPIEVMEVYCGICRQQFDADAADGPCIIRPEWVHGGPIRRRSRSRSGTPGGALAGDAAADVAADAAADVDLENP